VQFLEAALYLNLALGAFNLLVPAFPMDGGRVLRSFLARRMPFPKATHYAATVGRAVAVGMGLLGFLDLTGGGFWLLLIAFFIYMGASEEERAVQVQATLGDLRVRDVMTPPVPLRPDMSLEDALGMMVRTRQLAFPVVEEGGRVLGFLGLQELNSFERGNYWMTPVRLAMRVQVPSIAPDALATEALRRLSGEDDHLLVLRDGQLEGIVSKADVGRLVAILGVQRGAPQRLSW
jgi:CBS domain-containing protein